MRLRVIALRLFALASVLSAATQAPSATETPPLIWRDIAEIRILCLVSTDRGVDRGSIHDRICARARDIAAQGASAPVRVIDSVDPATLAPDSLTLMIHVSIEAAEGGRLAALSVRPFRNTGSEGALLFAAAPRAAFLSASQDEADALDRTLTAALSETLPWLARPAEPRPVHH